MAACLFTHQNDWSVDIPQVEEIEGITYYKIKIRIGNVSWEVKHRYKEFASLHSKLVSDNGLSKDILPPKKIINNKDPSFIEKRRSGLELYLTSVLSLLTLTLPEPLSQFLDFHKFDVIVLLQCLATKISSLNPTLEYDLDVIQVHAITERLKLPCPSVNMIGFQHDFSSILDFCGNLRTLRIHSCKLIHTTSNVVKSNLSFELSSFKTLKILVLNKINPVCLLKADDLRKKLERLSLICCGLKRICDILLCDMLHKTSVPPESYWTKLTEMDFSNNEIEDIGDTLMLVPNIESINFSSNHIQLMPASPNCPSNDKLLRLNLSKNNITSITDLNLNFNNLSFLDLSQNRISSLKGVNHLLSLQGFNISSNKLNNINELTYLTCLPKLDYVVLTGNPLSTIVDYRVKILEQFGERASKICLDNEQTTQQELDTVAVLRAIRFVKEGKSPKTSTFVTYSN